MASTSKINGREYSEILKNANFTPSSYQEIAESLMENGIRQMYHALVNEADILTLFSIPNLKIFWVCRCHHVADDKSTAHEHLHALVQYQIFLCFSSIRTAGTTYAIRTKSQHFAEGLDILMFQRENQGKQNKAVRKQTPRNSRV